MPLINGKVALSLKWYGNCILSSAETATITDTKLYVPVVTFYDARLLKLLSEAFKRSIYWNKYQAILTDYAENSYIRERRDASFQGVNKLFVLPYAHGDNFTNENSYRKCFHPRLKIKNYNIEIDGRNFYDESINDLIKQYDEIRKISIGQRDDYTTDCLLDFAYFEENYSLIAADLSKQKALDADSKAIPQIIFTGKTDNQVRVYILTLHSWTIKINKVRICKRNNKFFN